MKRIIGVHGVGHQFKGENTLCSEWLPALKDGLARANRRLVSDEDFVCAYYGNLFRPGGKAIDPPFDASDVADDWERELLELWWREAANVAPEVPGPDARTKLSTPSIVQRALNALSGSRYFAGIAERGLIFDLKQVRRYLREPDIRREARKSIERAIGPGTTLELRTSHRSQTALPRFSKLDQGFSLLPQRGQKRKRNRARSRLHSKRRWPMPTDSSVDVSKSSSR